MRIEKLDGLRGVCCLMVVFYHYPESYLPEFVFDNFFIRQSWSFVDFFFVLSGFVISYNYPSLSSVNDFFIYIKKRLIRLYPLLFFTTTVFLTFKLFSDVFFAELVNSPKSVKLYLLDTLNTLTMLNSTPIFGDASRNLGMNHPSWSVSAEFISYTVFGLSSIFLSKNKVKFSILLVFASVVLFVVKETFSYSHYTWFFLRGIIGFNMGCIVYRLSTKNYSINSFLELLLPILILLVFYLLQNFQFVYMGIASLVLRPLLFAFFIFVLINTSNYLSLFLESKPLKFLGKISYSIYLNHILLLLIIPRFIFNFLDVTQSNLSQILVSFFVILLVILYSSFTYTYIEAWFSNIFNRRPLR